MTRQSSWRKQEHQDTDAECVALATEGKPIVTLFLEQEGVKRKNQRARGHSTLLTYIVQAKQHYNEKKEVRRNEVI